MMKKMNVRIVPHKEHTMTKKRQKYFEARPQVNYVFIAALFFQIGKEKQV
jgi:hypothetical protein